LDDPDIGFSPQDGCRQRLMLKRRGDHSHV
jgi:hypothetical protein